MKNIGTAILAVLIPISVVFVFKPVLTAGFTNYDDDVLVTGNPLIKTITSKNLERIFFSSYCGLYHPLVLLSYSCEYKIAGLNPRTYHSTSLALHTINCLLVFWMILLIGGNAPVALLTTLFFGLHPLHVESVAWIAERKDVLYALFYLSSIIAYIYFKMNNEKRFYAVSLALFLFSLMSKPMAVTLPVALFLFDYLGSRKIDIKSAVEKVPYFILSIIFSVITVRSHYSSQDAPVRPVINLAAGLSGAVNGIIFYIAKIFWPVNLSCFYPYIGREWRSYFHFTALPFIFIFILAAAALYSMRRTRIAAFGAAFFVAALLPVLQLIPFGQEVPADRFTYIASIGIFFAVSEGFAFFWKKPQRLPRFMSVSIAALIVIVLSFVSNARCKVWQDSFTLWNDAIKKYPALPQAYKNRADAYKEAGLADKALQDYGQALILKSGYPQALNNRGNLFASLGQYRQAVEDYSSAIRENPGYVSAIYNRAIAFSALNDLEASAADYGLAIYKNPEYYEAFNNRGIIRAKQGMYGKAIEDFSKAISINQDFNEAYANRSFAYYYTGDMNSCVKDVGVLLQRKYPVNQAFYKALIDKKLIK